MKKCNKYLRNKDGLLSQYGLACGYVDESGLGEITVKLYADGDCYHVRLSDRNKELSKPFNDSKGGRFWLSFDNLTEARQAYKKLVKLVQTNKDYLTTVKQYY